jgi:hypothetical protein
MSDPTPREIFEAVGVTSGQHYQNLIDLYPVLKRPEAAWADSDWVIDAMEICKTAAEEVHRHLHPEITQKAAREAQEQDEAQKVYLALDGVLKKYGIPTKQSAYYVLRERYGITYKNPRWLEKRLKALGSYEYVQWPEAVDTRPPWIIQLHLDHFARKSKERRKKGVEKKNKKSS